MTEDLGDQIEYGKAVRAIQQKGRRYTLHFHEGASRQAEIIVCTIPFTVLRNIELQIHTGWDNTHMQGNNQGKGGYTVFLGGEKSLELAAHSTRMKGHARLNNPNLNQYLDRMDRIYSGFRNNFLDDHEVITWTENPNTLASYSCYKRGQWSTLSGAEILPIHDDFLFAGEHCSADFQGFMNGGAETGRQAAEGILEMVGVKRN